MAISCAQKDDHGYVGASDIRIEDGVMTPETLLALGRLSDPQLSPDGTRILYGVSYNSIADNRSCRNLFLCDADGSNPVQLTRYAKSVSNARWSLDGKSIFFLQGGQLWKAPLLGNKLGKREQLSDIPNGISEFKLSPDQSQVLYLSTIKNPALVQPADTDPALDKASAYTTEDLMYRHWDHWVTEIPRSYVATLANGRITPERSLDILGDEPFELPTEPFGGAEQLDWHPDGRHIAYSCRKKTGKQYAFSTNTGIYIYDILTGATTDVKTDGGYDTDPVWSPDGKKLAWISMPRDGYEADQQRLMVADIDFGAAPADGQSAEVKVSGMRNLTAALDRDAAGIVWNAASSGIYFNALTDGVQALFFVNEYDGEPRISRLTPADWNYDFFSPFAVREEGETLELLTSYYCLNFPVELVSVKISAGSPSFSQITRENDPIFAQMDAPSCESVWIPTVDGQQMQCWIMYPPKFDAGKVYPAIEIVLGGPQGTNSQDWSYRWNYRLMAQQGYVVILPNRRGTTAFGQAWKEEISGDYCGLNMQDYLSAGRYIKSKPFVGKLACVGASYGGYSAYMLEGLHGDLYDCFIAHAGIFDEKMLWYTTEEMWFANWDNGGLTEYAYTPGQTGPAGDGITFGGMQQAGAPYASTPKAQRHYANSPASMVTRWHTPILCIHGMMDYRIPYEQGMAAFNAAQMMGVPSKLVIFPEENHWILQPQNALYWHRVFYDWLDQWMK
ncbi:MAG: S9 family peptidase [Bacteroidales bacterium]|nr:S9 family peptidase [Bacteroidales bacterium]